VVKAEMEATIVIAVEREASIFNVDEAERNYQGQGEAS
jgi:ribosomal protein S17